MSTTDPTGDGGGGGTSTSVDDNATPSTDIAAPPGTQHQQQHPPPSPLSGCYLLVVLPEPHTAQHRDLILNRLAKGFLSWDKDSCHVDLEKELQALVAQAPEGEEARNGERLIQYATENLVTEVLIHPQTNTLLQCIRNLLASFTKHRHIIHAGYTFGGNGSWILQDGTFSLADFLDAFSEHEVQRVLRAYENSVTVDINCAGVGEWSTCRLTKEACTRSCRVRLNPDDVLTAGVPAIATFTNYIGQYLVPQTLDQLMEPSDVVGNIRFSHPTLYVFPGGQGDAALFGINGFNMLVDGGFARKACFWDFARHLDRLDAVLVTRVNNSNVGGMSSVLRKKREMHVYPQIGHFFCNLVERRHSNSPDGDKDLDPLTLNLIDIGQEMMVDLRQINLRAHPCYRDPNPINLYHKVGHGTLDMYVLSPSKDSREVREFLSKWHSSDSKLFAGSHKKDSNNLTFPIQNLTSICALLVWQPANPEDTITRILFPGSTPQHKIFEGFERLKHLDFLKHPVCSAKSLSPSTSLLALKDRPIIKQKLGLIEKESKKSMETKREKRDLPESKLSKAAADDIVSKPTPQTTPIISIPKAQPAKIDVKTKKVVENKKIETESKKIEKDLKEMKKDSTKKDIARMDKDGETKKSETMRIKIDTEKPVPSKEPKAKPELKKKDAKDPKLGKISKIEMPPKPAVKLLDKKPKPVADKKDSAKGSPPTPKKIMNGLATKVEIAGKTMPKPITKPIGKQPLSSMPAKSAKDANNRKVVEQKNIEIASAASAAAPASAKLVAKPKTSERKPISRRTKPVSPSKARVPGSPAKSTRSTPTTSVKSDKDGVIRKIKGERGTTDSSTVSTPSGIEIDSMTKLADKSLTEKSEDMSLDSIESKVLADLKEEREVVEEIEAVLQKAERIEEARKDDHLDGDDDITAEATDKKEDDMTEDDVTADIEEMPKKKSSWKASQELTEEDEYLIVEKEEIYIEDSAQSGEGEQKHVLDAVESEKVKSVEDVQAAKEEEETEIFEEKEKSDVPEKKLLDYDEETDKDKEPDEISPGHKEQLKEEMKDIIASAAEIVQKTEDKDDSGKKDSEDITKEPSSLSPDKFDSSEKKTTDTDPMKPEVDQKDQQVAEKLEESQERISTLESGATTTAPTLPEDERIPLDDIKEVIDEKYIVEENKEDSVEQVKESFVAPIPTEPKPDAKSFQVRPALQGVQREIVKTPDEVADLPVHEEVDPKLYRMEDFEKAKEEKPSAAPAAQQQETKEPPPTPPVKEQKRVFSFFGKVADKFEKGIDKLTGKSRRDSEKDIDEKSSSKSSSPKEAKPQEIILPSVVQADEVNEALAKAVKAPAISEAFEKGEPEVSKVKVAAITDTAAFLQREIEDLTKSTLPDQETKEIKDTVEEAGSEKPETKAESKPVVLSSDPVFETCVLKGQQKDILTGPVADVEEDVEDVEALLEEASKKFKTVKDSLRDSLESLEDKIVEEEMMCAELAAASKDVVKDTLSEVVEKLEEIKPHMEEPLDTKESEQVKFDIPKTEDVEDEEDLSDVTKDFKEAVRDVAEVLAGSAGILIEEKPKDVIEIVKKVAEELKKDDFLSHDVLFDRDVPKSDDKKSDGESESVRPVVEEIILKKVGITEELPPQEEIEEMLESGITTKPLTSYKSPAGPEIREEPCVKTITSKGIDVTSPIRDPATDKIDAMKICSDLMEEEAAPSRQKRSILDEDQTKSDVMEAGIESVCVKEEVKHQTSNEDDETHEIEGSDIVFDRKLSPDKAQMVIVTPDSAPASPKFAGAKLNTKEEIDGTSQLPTDVKNELDTEAPLEKIIENLLFTKKTKITIEIVEYITVVRKIPREKVIYIIEEVIIKKGVPRDSVVADLDLLRPDTASSEKRAEIEQYIDQEYITKNKRITIDIVEEISIKKFVTKRIVIEIIEEIIVKKKIPRDAILDISENEFSRLGGYRKERMSEQDAVPETSQVSDEQVDEIPEIDSSSTDVRSEIEKYIADDIISKGKKITSHSIDEISIAKNVPRRLFIEILEEIIIKRNIPRSSILDISEKEFSDIIMSEKEDMDRDEAISETEKEEEPDKASVSSETRLQVENNIIDEYVTKNRRITPHIFEEICVQNKVSRRVIIKIIEELVVKRKVSRSSILDISDIELEELLAAEKEQVEKEREAAASDDEDKKHHESEPEEYESVTSEKLSEIENSIIEEFISKSRRITPYIFEDICVRYKIPRRILIDIIEEIIIKRNVRRGSILDITDVELSELLIAAEAGTEEDELDVKPLAKQDLMPEDAGEDKLVDGFVSIPGKDDAPTKAVSPSMAVELAEQALKESDKDVTDDFEAVEQEYKIHGTPITTAKEPISSVHAAKSDEEKPSDALEEAIDDDVSDVVEADEKTIGAVAPITVATTTTETKSENISENLETVDTTEKYLIEAQEKVQPTPVKSLDDNLVDNTNEPKLKDEHDTEGKTTAQEDTTGRKDPVELQDHQKEVEEKEITSQEGLTAVESIEKTAQLPADAGIVTEVAKLSTAELEEEPSDSEEQESRGKSPATDDKIDITRAKRSTDEIRQQRKDSLTIQEHVEAVSISGTESPEKEKMSHEIPEDDETAVPTSTVRRMLVTASSEDGGHETEVCPTGSIIFTKTITPDDSLKSSPVKTTPDQDSLILDKESRSGASTPEKDSISGKSTPGTKDGDKITPEDSLDKSPSGTRESQDLEDSLDKSDLTKLNEVEKPMSLATMARDVSPSKLSATAEMSDEAVEGIIHEQESHLKTILDDKSSIEPTERSRTPSVAGEKITEKDLQDLVESRLASVGSEKIDDQPPIDHSKSPSIAGDELSKEDALEVDEKSRSPSVASEKHGDGEPAERSRSPSVAGDKIAEKDVKDLVEESKLSTVAGEKIDDKAPVERSKSPSIVGDKYSDKDVSEADKKSRSPSIASEKHDKDLAARSRSPSVVGDNIVEKDLKDIQIDESSAVSQKIDEKSPADRSETHSIAGDKLTEKDASEIDEKSRSSSITSEKHDGKELIDRSKSPSIAGDKHSEKIVSEVDDKSRSPSITSEKHDNKDLAEGSRSPSVAGDKIIEKDLKDIQVDESSTPSVVSAKIEEKAPTDRLQTHSIAADKLTEKDASEIDEKSRSSSITSEKHDGKELTDRSKSPSIGGDRHSDKTASEVDEKSRSPSIASDTQSGHELTKRSCSPSSVGDKITEKDLKELVDESKSPSAVSGKIDDKTPVELESLSAAGDKHSEKAVSEVDEKSRSTSIASEKHDGKEPVERSRSPSVAGDNIAEKDLKALVDESKLPSDDNEKIYNKAPVDHSISPVIPGDEHSEKDTSDIDKKSRSPSVASEKDAANQPSECPRTSSVADDEFTESHLKEVDDEIKSSSIAVGEKIDDKALVDHSKSSSIDGDKRDDCEKSRSPSVDSEKPEVKESAEPSIIPSVAVDKSSEEDLKELRDGSKSPSGISEYSDAEVAVDRSKSPSITGDRHSVKTASEVDEKSRSPSIASDKYDGKEPAERSRSPSIAGDKITDKDLKEIVEPKRPGVLNENIDGKVPVDRSKSPSIVGDKYSEKDTLETDEKSRSPSIASEKHDGKESTVPSRSPSIASEKIVEKELEKLVDKPESISVAGEHIDLKAPIDRSKSPSIAGDGHSEKDASEVDEKSRSPSIASEKHEGKESAASSRTPSIAGDKITDKDSEGLVDEAKTPGAVNENIDDKVSIDRSKSPSVVGDKHSEKDALETHEKSRSPSIASEKHDGKVSPVPSRSPSIAGENIAEKELEKLVDKPESISVAGEHIDLKAPIDRSKSPSIAGDGHTEKDASEVDEKSRSPSIASEKHEGKESAVPSRTSSIAGDKITEKDSEELVDDSKTPGVLNENIDDKASVDRSKSPSIAGDKHSEKDALETDEKSRSPSIASEKHDGKESAVPSRSPSIAGEKIVEKELEKLVDKPESISVAGEQIDIKAPIDRSKSPSIAGDEHSEKDVSEVNEKSRSPSFVSEKHEGKESAVPSRTPSIAGDKSTEKDSKELIDEHKATGALDENIDDKAFVDRSKSPSIAGDKHSEKDALETHEKSRSPSIASEKHDGKETAVQSRTSSVAGDVITETDLKELVDESKLLSALSEKTDDKAPVDRSKSPSIAGDTHSEKDVPEVNEKSRSPSVASEKHDHKDLAQRSRSPSVAGDKMIEKDLKELADVSKLPTVVSEQIDDKKPVHYPSQSIISEKDASAVDEKSRSPSIDSEKHDGKEPATRSRSSSVTGNKDTELAARELDDECRSPTIGDEKGDNQVSVDRSKSPSISGDKHSEKNVAEVDEKSRSPSVGSIKHDHQEPVDPDVEVTERHLEKSDGQPSSFTTLTSHSTAGDKHSEPSEIATAKPDDKSRSPTIADEKHKEIEPTVESRSPSIVSDKHDEDKSHSPSIDDDKKKGTGDEHSVQDATKQLEKPKLSSFGSEKTGDEAPVDESKPSSIAGDDHSEKDIVKPGDASRKFSLASEKHSDNDATELDKSRSPSIASEKPDDKLSIDHSRSASIAGDICSEKDVAEPIDKSRSPSIASEKPDDKLPIDHSRPVSIAGDRCSEKDVTEPIDKSRSPSIASEKPDDKLPIDHSRPASIAGDRCSEKDVTEPIDKSRSPSILSEKPDDTSFIERSRSPSVTSNKCSDDFIDTAEKFTSPSLLSGKLGEQESDDAKELLEKSRSPSITSEKSDVKESVEHSKSLGISGDKHSEEHAEVVIKKSGPSSIVDEQDDEKESLDRLRSSSIVADDHDRKEPIDDAIVDDKQIEMDTTKSLEKSRSPSITGVKHDEQGPIDLSKPSPTLDDKISDTDISRLSTKINTPDESLDHAELTDPGKVTVHQTEEKIIHSSPPALDRTSCSPSIESDTLHRDEDDEEDIDRQPTDKSRSTSIVSVHDSKLDEKDAVQALQKLAETIAEKSEEAKHITGSPLDETEHDDTPKDRSRSHSVFDAGEKTTLGRSRTGSLFEDRVPEVLSLRGEATTASQEPGGTHNYDESDETEFKDSPSGKSSLKDVPDDKKDSVSSDSTKSSLAKFEDGISKLSSVAIQEDVAGQFAADYHTTTDEISKVEEYIVNKYIIKKEKITSRLVEEIVMLYSMPKSMILELIEAIIMKKNVPRDFVVDYPKHDETCDSAVTSKDDHVDVIDIPPANRHDIESYIQEEFITKNKKISSKILDDLVTLKSVPRHIIIMIIEEIITKRKIQRAELVEDGIIDESSKLSETDSYGPMKQENRLCDEENLPSMSTEFNISSQPSISSLDMQMQQESGISEQKRVQVESYVMEECVKKGKKITVLVLEQIMTKMSVSRSVLLNIIENIIVTRKMSRETMVDDAIYDDADTGTSKSPEFLPTKDRIVEFSGKSTPDPKSSGYSTPETRQYDDKFSKEMSSYSTDYESPFHKAFVGGMTEIRTTHITTLSGKSTPDFGPRGETPESLSDSMTSSSQTKPEEKVPSDKERSHTSGNEFSETVEQAPSISTAAVAMTTASTTASYASASVPEQKDYGTSVASETAAGKQAYSDDLSERVKRDTVNIESKSQLGDMPDMTKRVPRDTFEEEGEETTVTTKIIRKEVISEEEPEVITRIIRRQVIGEEEDEEPEVITRVIRREIIDQDDDVAEDYQHPTISRRISNQEGSPDMIETITRTTKAIVTEDIPHYEKSDIQTTPEKITSEPGSTYVTRIPTQDTLAGGPISADVKRTITTVTTVTEPDGKVTTKKNVQETTDTLEGEELLEKLLDSTKTEDSDTLTDAKSIESLKTEKIITETIKTVASASGSSAPGIRGDFDSGKSTSDSGLRDEIHDTLTKSTLEKIVAENVDHPISPIIKDLISEQRSYSGKSSPEMSLPKDTTQLGSSTGKSTPEVPVSPFTRDGSGSPAAAGTLGQTSGRSTPDKRADSRSSTATPEGFRSSEVIRTTITTTRTMSEDGDIMTTTKEITEATNEKGEVTILTEKTDVKFEDRVLSKDVGESSPKSDHSSMHSRAGTHAWEGSEERHTYSDDEVPGSPLSTTSQVGYSPQSTYHFGEQSFGKDSSHKSIEFSEADMSSSFYGELPDLPPRVTTLKAAYLDSSSSETPGASDLPPAEGDFSFKKFTVEKEFAGGFSEKSGGKRYVDDADLDFEKALMERKEMKRDRDDHTSTATSGYTNGNLTKPSSSSLTEETTDPKADTKKDPLADWGTPLGLPSPKPPRKFNFRTTARPTNSADISPDSLNFDAINDWGEPLRLPSPAPVPDEASNKGTPATPKKERKQPKKVISENMKNRKRSESPSKNEKKTKDAKNKVQPVYMDLTYVPHHGNSYYTSLEFFKRVRARYYVFSGTEPSREVYDALLDAKKTWEDKELEVTMIPTYDTDTLGYWVADNEEALAANHIDLSPSASRCTINLQDHETSCSAYRLEF